jgi:hypothetical protein
VVSARLNWSDSALGQLRSLLGTVQWIVVFIAVAVILAGVLAIAAVVAAGEADGLRELSRPAEEAIWAAGFSLNELHLLSVMASVARTDLDAATVEVVLRQAGSLDGIVVTGSRVPRERIGTLVAFGQGLSGRVLASGRSAVQGRVVAAAITGGQEVLGAVVAARGGRPLGAGEVAHLEGLAAEVGRQLEARVRHERPPGHRLVG